MSEHKKSGNRLWWIGIALFTVASVTYVNMQHPAFIRAHVYALMAVFDDGNK